MFNFKKLITVTACVATLALGSEFVINVNNTSSVKAALVWHSGSPKALRGYWKYDLHTGRGGGWGQFAIYKNSMTSIAQGDPLIKMHNVRYKYNSNGIYTIKVVETSMIYSKGNHTKPGTSNFTMKLKLIDSNNMAEYEGKSAFIWHRTTKF